LPGAADVLGYLALGLTGCAGVAVLGARRPGVGAWNFVLLGLLLVLLLPLAEGGFLGGEVEPGGVRLAFLTATLAVGLGNYLPTRLGAGAGVLLIACAGQLLALFGPRHLERLALRETSCLLAGCAPWVSWLNLAVRRPPGNDLDRLWLGFRDRFGLVWGLRLREQFNRAAANAGWPVRLGWSGFEELDSTAEPAPREILHALLKRFGPENDAGPLGPRPGSG
jgi:hypothetical protein